MSNREQKPCAFFGNFNRRTFQFNSRLRYCAVPILAWSLCLLFSLSLTAQTVEERLDSIKQYWIDGEIDRAKAVLDSIDLSLLPPVEKATCLYISGRIKIKNRQRAAAKQDLLQAWSLFEMEEQPTLYGNIGYYLGFVYFYQNEYDSVYYYANKVQELKTIPHYDTLTNKVAWSYNMLGMTSKRQGDYRASSRYYTLALEAYKLSAPEGVNAVYQNLSNLYIEQTDYLKAAEVLFQAIRFNEEKGDSLRLANNYHSLALLYGRQQNYQTAIQMLDIADWLICPFQEDYARLYYANLRNQALYHLFLCQPEIALDYIRHNLVFYEQTEDQYMEVESTFILARIYLALEELDSAEFYFNQAKRIFEPKKFEGYWLDWYYFTGQLASTKGNYSEALKKYQSTAIELEKYGKDHVSRRDLNTAFAETYEQLGNYAKATKHALLALEYADSVQQEISPKDLRSFFLELENEKKEFKLEEQKLTAETLANRRGRINILLAVIVGLLLLGGYLLVRLLNYRKNFANRLSQEVQEKTSALQTSQNQLQKTHDELKLFYAAIAHDLRYPILYVQANLEELRKEFPENQTVFLQNSKAALDNLYSSFIRLLDFFHLEEEPLNIKSIDLNDLLKDVIQELKRIQALDRLEIIVEELPTIQADTLLLRMVFINLIINAEKFTRQSAQPTLKISSQIKAQNVHLFFEDNGKGIDPKLQESLFQSFVSEKKVVKESLGIGLFMVKRIMERHGGCVSANNKMVTGATFELVFPL